MALRLKEITGINREADGSERVIMATSSLDARILEKYHRSPGEQRRTADLLRLIPPGHGTVLDAGARDGFYSALLAERFISVTALDLVKPPLRMERVQCVEGDITQLKYPDRNFDVVFCTEVLEHVAALEKACAELMRVAKCFIIIGVPYRQDTRIGRTTCGLCGNIGPPWGHVNVFDELKLERLFRPWIAVEKSFVGESRERTNELASWLMDLGGNPWGEYENQNCIHCGGRLFAPDNRCFRQKMLAAAGFRITKIATLFSRPHGNWIHIVFRRNDS